MNVGRISGSHETTFFDLISWRARVFHEHGKRIRKKKRARKMWKKKDEYRVLTSMKLFNFERELIR